MPHHSAPDAPTPNAMKRQRTRKRPDTPQPEQPFFAKAGPTSDLQPKPDDGFFQPKLTLGKPGDAFEHEADRMADAVVNHTQSAPSSSTDVRKKDKVQRQSVPEEEEMPMQGKLQKQEEEEEAQPKLQLQEEEEEPIQAQEEEEEMQAQPEEEEEEPLQAKLQKQEEEEEEAQPKLQLQEEEEEEAQPKLQRQALEEEEPIQAQEDLPEEEEKPLQTKSEPGSSMAARLSSNRGKGSPLPPKTQAEMGDAFGTDFSSVRIHTDAEAVQMNRQLKAQAFTNGQDIYFNKGKYSPESTSGKHLLAHELTHVVQQKGKKK